jgi:hypothetical protein
MAIKRVEKSKIPATKKFRRAQSNIKQMIIFAYDHREIIMADVPCGTSATAAYYRGWLQKLHRKFTKPP